MRSLFVRVQGVSFHAVLLLAVCSIPVQAQVASPGAIEPQMPAAELPSAAGEDLIVVPSQRERQQQGAAQTLTVNRIDVGFQNKEAVPGVLRQGARALVADFLAANGTELSFVQLEQVTAELTDYLRGKNLLLGTAFLPAQDVVDGVVTIKVLEGRLEDVLVENNERYRGKVIRGQFEDGIGGPIYRDAIESGILRLNDMPGFKSAAIFKPGTEMGSSRLAVKVEEEDRVEYNAQIDNHGIESTGEGRVLLGAEFNNVTGHIDALSIAAIKTFSSGELEHARVGYQITLPDLVHTLGISHSETGYEVTRGVGSPDPLIEGDTSIGEVFVKSQWVRQSDFNLYTRAGLALKRAEVDLELFDIRQGVDKLSVFELGVVAEHVDVDRQAVHRATLTYSRGIEDFIGSMDDDGDMNALRQNAQGEFISGEFDKWTASYTRLQSVSGDHSLLLRLQGQYSDDMLSSLEQMGLGGPYTVRAYPVSEYVRDKAVFASLAWVINGGFFSEATAYGENSWADIMTVSVFADYAHGKLNEATAGQDESIDISGAGIEVDFRFPELNAFARVSAASPITSIDARNNEDFQYWVTVGVDL